MSRIRLLRIGLLVIFVAALLLGLIGAVTPQSREPVALVIDVDGIINSVKERFIARALEQAQEEGAALVIIRLDTPGGLLSSTRGIVELLLATDIPVAVYVYPQGARAGSAGAFITAAAHFAVMSPGTNIGAATPVSSTGEDVGETLANKVTNDAAALMRSIAERRGRNQDKLEETVREAASFTATEAVQLEVVDFIASDMDDLLARLDGKNVQTRAGLLTLETRDLRQQHVRKNLLEHFLEFISDPNVSFVLMTVGVLGILIEVFSPGLIVPSVVGVMCLLLAFLALGNLPANWVGIAFIALALILAALEILVSGFGFLGIAAIVSLLIGGFLLFAQFGAPSPTLPPVSVNRWLLVGVGGALGASMLYLVWVSFRSRRAERETSDVSSLVGSVGLVTLKLDPRGVVSVAGETWTAVSDDGTVIDAGKSVIISGVDGLVVTVFAEDSEST